MDEPRLDVYPLDYDDANHTGKIFLYAVAHVFNFDCMMGLFSLQETKNSL